MKEYYRLCRLERGRSIHLEPEQVCVDLDAARESSPIINDQLFLAAVQPDVFFWISGGGTLLVEERYLIVVERSRNSRVHPGKFSLFTGRADNEFEWREPRLLLRELFEELIIVDSTGAVRVPRFPGAGVEPSKMCQAFCARTGRQLASHAQVGLSQVEIGGSQVQITSGGATRAQELLLHINELRDINALYVLEPDLMLDGFWALDGEADQYDSRRVFALDVASMVATNITLGANRSEIRVEEEQLTQHCRFLLEAVRHRHKSR